MLFNLHLGYISFQVLQDAVKANELREEEAERVLKHLESGLLAWVKAAVSIFLVLWCCLGQFGGNDRFSTCSIDFCRVRTIRSQVGAWF